MNSVSVGIINATVWMCLITYLIVQSTPIIWKKNQKKLDWKKSKKLSVKFSDKLHKRSEVEILVRNKTESNNLDIVECEMHKIGQLTDSSKENTTRVFLYS